MYCYDENLFRDRWLGPPGVPWLPNFMLTVDCASVQSRTKCSNLWPRCCFHFGKRRDLTHGFRTTLFCPTQKLVCNEFHIEECDPLKIIYVCLHFLGLRMSISALYFLFSVMEMMLTRIDAGVLLL